MARDELSMRTDFGDAVQSAGEAVSKKIGRKEAFELVAKPGAQVPTEIESLYTLVAAEKSVRSSAGLHVF